VLVWALVVIATLITLVSSLTLWSKRQLLSTDNWTRSSAKLLQNDQIRTALSVRLVDLTFQQTNAKARLKQQLPKNLQGAAPFIAAGLQTAATRATEAFLATSRAQNLWEQANRAAHERLVAILEKKDVGRFSSSTGALTLDLGPFVKEVESRLGLQGTLSSRTNANGQIVLVRSDQLKTAQDAVRLLNILSVWLVVAAFVLYALAIYLARGKRRRMLEVSGAALLFVGLIVLIVRRLVGDALVNSVVKTDADRPAVHAMWLIETDLLRDIGLALILYGLLALVAGFLGGPSRIATGIRRHLTPAFRRHLAAVYAVAALVFLLFVAWGPTEQSRRLGGVVLFAALLVLAIEVWRRQALREFPDEPEIVVATAAAAPATDGSSVETLERLARLRNEGALSEDEFQRQKAELLGSS
jgi:hypothetical protein